MSRAPVVLLLLASCATVSPERGHDRVAALVEERGGGATGWEQGPPGDDVIAERVAALLKQGLTRERAVAIALVNNPALLARYEDLGIAQAELVDAGLLSNPTLDGSVGFPLRGELLEFEGALLTNLLELLLLPSRKRIAAAQFDAATLQVAHDALQLVADVRKAFVSVQAAERTVELQQAAVAAAAAAAELTARQREAGNVSELQLVTERAAYERRRLELARDQLELLERREELNRLLGLWGGATGWALAEPLPELPKDEPPLERLESTALRRRLDVAAARKRAAVQEQALALARTTRYFGRVEIGAHTHRDPDGPLLVGPSLVLELPIFNQRQGLLARLEATARQARRQLDALAVDVRSRVRLGRARLLTARGVVEHYRSVLLPLQQSVVEQSLRHYNGMFLHPVQLLAARREQLETTRDYVAALREYWSERAELELLAGGVLPREADAAKEPAGHAPASPHPREEP